MISTTTIAYRLSRSSALTVRLFDAAGREVLRREFQAVSGEGAVSVNLENLSTGLYFARLEAGQAAQVRSLLLLK